MNTSPHPQSFCRRCTTRRHGERGFLVIALLGMVAIMLIYVNFNLRMLGHLKHELKLVEQQQIKRLEKAGADPMPLPSTRTNFAGSNSSK